MERFSLNTPRRTSLFSAPFRVVWIGGENGDIPPFIGKTETKIRKHRGAAASIRMEQVGDDQ